MKINYRCHKNVCFNIILEVQVKHYKINVFSIKREQYFPSFHVPLQPMPNFHKSTGDIELLQHLALNLYYHMSYNLQKATIF